MPDVRIKPAEWEEVANADNGAATATKAADASYRHYITGVEFSFAPGGPAAAVLATLVAGGKTRRYGVGAAGLSIQFTHPVECTANEAAVASLAASGTAGQIGNVNLRGFSVRISDPY